MAYTPINWQTGDTITAEKMNKMDNGWGVSGGERTLICNETVTTEANEYGAVGTFSFSTEINAPRVVVTFDGVEYFCLYNSGDHGYGDYEISTFPFFIDYYEGVNELWTATAGTYSVKIEEGSAPSVEVSQNFVSAVALQATLGETTFQEIVDALDAGRIVVIKDGSGTMEFVGGTDSSSTPLEVYAINVNSANVNVSTYVANSASSPINYRQ